MTLKELKERVDIHWVGYGTYRVWIIYRNTRLSCISHDSCAYDRITSREDWNDREEHCFYTLKQAYKSVWDYCKRCNGIYD